MTAKQNNSLSAGELSAAIASSAEGYSFPTNLDRDPPKGGLAPETQQALFARALDEDMSEKEFGQILDQMIEKPKIIRDLEARVQQGSPSQKIQKNGV